MTDRIEERRERTLQFIGEYSAAHGKGPTYREIMRNCGHNSLYTVVYDVKALREDGRLSEERDSWGGVGAIPQYTNQGGRNVQILGSVRCGEPNEAIENVEESMLLPVELLGSGEFFMLRARGESMVDAGIFDGDLIVVRRQPTAENGEIVIAGVDGDQATAKKLEIRNGKYYLVPCSGETDDYGNPFREIDLQEHERWEIFGKVILSIHRPRAKRW